MLTPHPALESKLLLQQHHQRTHQHRNIVMDSAASAESDGVGGRPLVDKVYPRRRGVDE